MRLSPPSTYTWRGLQWASCKQDGEMLSVPVQPCSLITMLTTKPKGLYQPSKTFLKMSSKTGLEEGIMVQLLRFGSAFVEHKQSDLILGPRSRKHSPSWTGASFIEWNRWLAGSPSSCDHERVSEKSVVKWLDDGKLPVGPHTPPPCRNSKHPS